MREIDLTMLMWEIVLKRNRIKLSLPPALSRFLWHDGSIEEVIERFIHHASSINHPARPLRIAVRQRAKLQDLEKFFGIYPTHWIQLRIEGQGSAGYEEGARKILEDLGYRCEEWVGVEDSGQQLAAFCLEMQREPKLVFWADNHKCSHKCDLLIPVTQRISLPDCQ